MADFKSRYISEVEQGKGLIGGAKSAASSGIKDFKEQFSKESLTKKAFGGDDLLSALIRSKMGIKKEKKGKSPSREGEEGLGSEAIPILVAIAKNTMVLPGMARDMKTLSQNIQKLVKLKGGKATSGASDFFRKQKEKAAGKLIPGKSKSPVSAGAGKAAPKTGVMDILGNIAGFIGGALTELIKFLFNPMAIIRLLSKLALPALIIGTIVSGIISGWRKYQETGSFVESIISYAGGMLEFLTLGLFGESEVKNLLSLLGDVFKPVIDSVSKIFESIKGVFKNIFGDYIKIEEKPKEEPKPKDGQKEAPKVPKVGGSDGVAEKMTGEVSGVMKEAGLPGLPEGLGGDLGSVMDSMAKGDLKGVASQAEAMKQKYPPQAGPKAETPEEQSARNYELNKTLTSKASSAIGVDLPMPAAPSPVASAPPSAAPTAVPSKSGGSKSAELDAQWEAQYLVVKQKHAENVAAVKALALSPAYQNASEDERAKMIKTGPAEEARIAFNTENQKLTKLAKELKEAKKSENQEPINVEGATGGPVVTPTPAPPAPATAPTPAAGGIPEKTAAQAESSKMGALNFIKKLGILPGQGPNKDEYEDMRAKRMISEEEVRSRISAAGKDPDKVLGLLKSADGKGKIDLSSGNLNTITGGAVGGGGGGAPPAPSVTPAPMTGEPPVSGASLSSASTDVAEAQRMESAADQGSVVNAPTNNNSSSSSGKPSKQTASAYDSDFAQRLATT